MRPKRDIRGDRLLLPSSLLCIQGFNMPAIVMPADNIPEGTTVTKVTGQNTYTLKRSIKIYGEQTQEIKYGEGIMFLISPHGNITAITSDTELRVRFNNYIEMAEFIDDNLRSHQ